VFDVRLDVYNSEVCSPVFFTKIRTKNRATSLNKNLANKRELVFFENNNAGKVIRLLVLHKLLASIFQFFWCLLPIQLYDLDSNTFL
jgi:hypothetical protein